MENNTHIIEVNIKDNEHIKIDQEAYGLAGTITLFIFILPFAASLLATMLIEMREEVKEEKNK